MIERKSRKFDGKVIKQSNIRLFSKLFFICSDFEFLNFIIEFKFTCSHESLSLLVKWVYNFMLFMTINCQVYLAEELLFILNDF
ncbi:Uncharacterised protein [Yersinia frederiksenii]|nr:Uncharacterised protein [Yersinia frederiksenii]